MTSEGDSADRPIVLPRRLDGGWVERHADHLAADGAADGPLLLSLERVARFELMAESRLLGLLMNARRQRPVRIKLGSELDLASERPERLVKLLRDTLGGVLLVELAEQITDSAGVDRRPELRQLQGAGARDRGGVFGFGREWATPIVDAFGGPAPAPLVTGANMAFEALFRERVGALGLGELADSSLQPLVEYSYEAFDNTRTHGASTLDRRPIEGLRFILQRAVNADRDRLAQLSEESGDAAVAHYLRQLADGLETSTQVQLVELTICDSGIGIPARMAGTEAIYSGPHEQELDMLLRAFELLQSTSRAPTGRGRGMFKILRATRALDGMLTVRCGRTLLHRGFASGNSEWAHEQRAYLPGTAVSLLSPWRPDRQLTLGL